ncbi:MAG: Holliday junction branch migration protein RuvA [Ruminococcaceae bacterium]|nr:Holliday junction branch migration protein RuvA [Oscillospiraceae bacterium]
MFYYIMGTVAHMEEGLAVIDCGGVGYACHTTTSTLSRLKKGETAKLFTYCNIKEDAFDIYGFFTNEELKSFQMLLSVSGVGPKVALSILSYTSPDRLSLAIMTGDEKALTQVQGVGKKMAQRIILELKDKLGSMMTEMDSGFEAVASVNSGGKAAEAAAALAALGYSASEAGAALKGIDVDTLPVEEIIRAALKKMMK